MAVNRLMRFAFGRPHVFIACVPGGADVRFAVERFTRERGWPLATSPADADLLAVCGAPAGWLADAVEVLWAQLPAPRSLVQLTAAEATPDALLDARDTLLAPAPEPAMAEHAESPDRSEHTDHSEHTGHEEPEGHGGHHDHTSMEVAGLPMADRGPDRDGLRLDQLTVSLGPFLPAWPAGLRLRLELQGDVAHEVIVEAEPAADSDLPTTPYQVAAGRLDALAALLDVTGAEGAALRARRLRDQLLNHEPVGRALATFSRTLRRSRLLRAATDGVADLHGSDATARWQRWLTDAKRVLDGEQVVDDLLAQNELGDVLTGLELGGLRIAVASLVPPHGMSARAGSAVHAHG